MNALYLIPVAAILACLWYWPVMMTVALGIVGVFVLGAHAAESWLRERGKSRPGSTSSRSPKR